MQISLQLQSKRSKNFFMYHFCRTKATSGRRQMMSKTWLIRIPEIPIIFFCKHFVIYGTNHLILPSRGNALLKLTFSSFNKEIYLQIYGLSMCILLSHLIFISQFSQSMAYLHCFLHIHVQDNKKPSLRKVFLRCKIQINGFRIVSKLNCKLGTFIFFIIFNFISTYDLGCMNVILLPFAENVPTGVHLWILNNWATLSTNEIWSVSKTNSQKRSQCNAESNYLRVLSRTT